MNIQIKMYTHKTKHSPVARRTKVLHVLTGVALVFTVATPAHAASSWNPTLLVNTESFNTIDEGDGSTSIEMRFGGTLNEKIIYNRSSNRFEFTRGVFVNGDITGTGALSIQGVMSGAHLRVDNNADIWGNLAVSGSTVVDGNITLNGDSGGANAVLTFGNDGGDETITFNDGTNEFDISDDVNVTGTLDTTGNITTDANLTINEDNGGANAVLTFGNDSGAETLTFSDSSNNFELSDDIDVTGAIDATSDITTDANLTINNDSGGADAVLTFGNDAANETIRFSDTTNAFEVSDDFEVSGTLSGATIHSQGSLTVSGSLAVEAGQTITLNGVPYSFPSDNGTNTQVLTTDGGGGLSWTDKTAGSLTQTLGDDRYVNQSGDTMTGALSIVDETGAAAGLEVTSTISGATITAQDFLSSSGTLSVDGAADLQSTVTIGGATTISNTLDTTGNITTDANLTINEDNGAANAVLTFGNDSGAETITFNDGTNEFDISDDVNVTGTFDATSNITTNANLTINADDGGADAVLTFGNDAAAETLTFSDTSNNFELSDDLDVTGNVTATGNLSGSTLTVDGDITIRNITYTFPGADGTSGQQLTTDGAGNLTWDDGGGGVGSGGVISLSPEYPHAVYFSSGSLTTGQMTYDYDATNNENFYRWTSTKAAVNDYWASIRVRVPDTFSTWDQNEPIEFRYRTGSGQTTGSYLALRMEDTAGANIPLTGGENLANTSWTTATITGPESTGTYTPGSYITLFLKMAAMTSTGSTSWTADAGFIDLNWETTAP